VLHHEQVVAGGDAAAAVRDHVDARLDADRGEPRTQRLGVLKAAVGAEVLARREAASAGDVTETRVAARPERPSRYQRTSQTTTSSRWPASQAASTKGAIIA
jgi:hypothetical protein